MKSIHSHPRCLARLRSSPRAVLLMDNDDCQDGDDWTFSTRDTRLPFAEPVACIIGICGRECLWKRCCIRLSSVDELAIA